MSGKNLITFFCAAWLGALNAAALDGAGNCGRIVSLAPSITEIVYELGLGSGLAGVTRYDRYPPEVSSLPRLGGFFDPSLEALTAMRPDTVMLLRESSDLQIRLKELNLRTLILNHGTVSGILDSINRIGDLCGKQSGATRLLSRIKARIDSVRSRTAGRPAQRTLIVIGSGTAGDLRNLFVSGGDGFYSELLSIAGGKNVQESRTLPLSGLSPEGILELDPQVIITIASEEAELKVDRKKLLHAWRGFPAVSAVRHNRLYLVQSDYASIPGPRFVNLLEDFENILHKAEGRNYELGN